MNNTSNSLLPTQFCNGYARWPNWSKENNVCIKFGGGEGLKEFDRGLLEKIPYFKSELAREFGKKEFNLEKFTSDDIRLLFSLFHDMWPFSHAVKEEFLTVPDFYIHLEEMIDFFMEDEAFGAKYLVAEEMRTLPYCKAVELMKNYYARKQEITPLPFFLEIAKEVVGSKAFFQSEQDYLYHQIKIGNIHNKVLDLLSEHKVKMAALKISKDPSKNAELNKVIYNHNRADNSTFAIELFKKELRGQLFSLTQSNSDLMKVHERKYFMLKPSELYALSHRKILLENIEQYCETYVMKKAWKIYKAKIFNNLQYYQKPAHMHRSEFLCAKLFAHYNLDLKKFEYSFMEKKGVFQTNPMVGKNGFVYYFNYPEGADLRTLEDEIRKDISNHRGKLPERLLPEDVAVIKVCKEEKIDLSLLGLRSELLPSFSRKLNSEEKESLAQRMINLWGWEKYGIEPQDVYFDQIPVCEDLDKVRVTGTLKYNLIFGENTKVFGGEYEYEFYFNLSNFEPIILHPMIDPSPKGTSQFLERYLLKKRKIELYEQKQMIWPLNALMHIGLKELHIVHTK